MLKHRPHRRPWCREQNHWKDGTTTDSFDFPFVVRYFPAFGGGVPCELAVRLQDALNIRGAWMAPSWLFDVYWTLVKISIAPKCFFKTWPQVKWLSPQQPMVKKHIKTGTSKLGEELSNLRHLMKPYEQPWTAHGSWRRTGCTTRNLPQRARWNRRSLRCDRRELWVSQFQQRGDDLRHDFVIRWMFFFTYKLN